MRPQRSHQHGPPSACAGPRWRRRRAWSKVAALVPVLLLPAALSGASSALLVERPSAPLQAHEDPRGLGASGRLPQEGRPSPELLRGAEDPRELATGPEPPPEVPTGELGIPGPLLGAYTSAADRLARTRPGCGVHWSVLASIGRIESGHARDGDVDVRGTTVSAILGPRLSGGPGIAAVPDTDGGEIDGDPVWDRAVGAMQFIPETWREYAADGDDDGVASPHNIHDAALSAGRFLCAGGADLRNSQELARAVFRYNHSDSYVRTVLVWAAAYALGVVPTPSQPVPEVDEAEILAHSAPPNRPEIVALPPAPPQPGGRPDDPSPSHPAPAPPELPEESEFAEPSAEGAEQSEVDGSEPGGPESEASAPEVSAPGESESAETEQEPEVLSDSVAESLSEFAESQGVEASGDAEGSSEVSASGGDASSEPEPSTTPQEPSFSGAPGAPDDPPAGHRPPAAGSSGSTSPESTPTAGAPSEDAPPAGTPSEGTPPEDAPSSGAPQPTGAPSESAPPSSTSPPEGRPSGAPGPPAPCDPAVLEQGAFVTDPAGTAPQPGATPSSDARPGGIVFTSAAGSPEIAPCRVPDEFAPKAEPTSSAPFTTGSRTSQHP